MVCLVILQWILVKEGYRKWTILGLQGQILDIIRTKLDKTKSETGQETKKGSNRSEKGQIWDKKWTMDKMRTKLR